VANEHILREKSFFKNAKDAWINRSRRLWFSHVVIRDHNDAWLEERLSEPIPKSEFHLHSDRKLSREVCTAILKELNLSHLTPVNRPWIQRL